MSLRLAGSNQDALPQDSAASLELRLRRIHRRRRREQLRRFFGMAFWGSGLLAAVGLVISLALAAVLR